MTTVDLAFPITSVGSIPADHGYLLYAGLSRALPLVHRQNGIGVHPIRGTQTGARKMQLGPQSRLILRADSEILGELIQVAGKRLDVAGTNLRVGVPQVYALRPATALRSRLVTIKLKDGLDESSFRESARRQLDALDISPDAVMTLGKRRTLRIKDKEVVGYEVIMEALSAEESLNIQEKGLGGRRHMGCGVFVPSTKQPTQVSVAREAGKQ